MALEKSKLIIEIETKSKGSIDRIDAVSAKVKTMGEETAKASSKSSKAVEKMSNEYERLAKTVMSSPDIAKQIEMSGKIDSVIESFEKLNKQAELLTATFSRISAASAASSTAQQRAAQDADKATQQSRNSVELLDKQFQSLSTTKDEVLDSYIEKAMIAREQSNNLTAGVKALGASLSVTGAIQGGVFAPGMQGLAERAETVGPILEEMGVALRATDSDVKNIMGTISLLSGLMLGSFAFAVNFIIGKIANLSLAIGRGLFASMRNMEERFMSFEKTIAQFTFGVGNYTREIGESILGTVEFWEQKIDDIVKGTRFGIEDIAKSIKLIVSEASALGLGFEEMQQLVARAVDIASFHSRDLTDTMLALLSSMTGNTQAALALGIDLRELALTQSELFLASDKAYNAMSEQEKVTLRFNQIMKKTNPLIGAAAEELNTFSAKVAVLERSFDRLAMKIGKMGKFTDAIVGAGVSIANSFLDLPDLMLESMGTAIDLGSVFFLVTGTILKFAGALSLMITSYKILNAGTRIAAASQSTLGVIFREVIGVGAEEATRKVTGLSDAVKLLARRMLEDFSKQDGFFMIFGGKRTKDKPHGPLLAFIDSLGILKTSSEGANGSIVKMFKTFASNAVSLLTLNGAIKGLGSLLVSTFTSAFGLLGFFAKGLTRILVIIAPFILRFGLIVTAVTLLKNSIVKFFTETDAGIEIMNNVSEIFREVAEAMGFVTDQADDLWTIIKGVLSDSFAALGKIVQESMHIIVLTVGTAILYITKLGLIVKRAFTDSKKDIKELDKSIDAIDQKIDNLAQHMLKSGVAIAGMFEATAIAEEAQKSYNDELRKHNQLQEEKRKKIAQVLGAMSHQEVRVSVLGTEFEKAALKIKQASKEQEKARQAFMAGTEAITEFEKATKEVIQAQAELEKLKYDGILKLEERLTKTTIDRLRRSKNLAESNREEKRLELSLFDKEVSAMTKVVKLTDQQKELVTNLRKAIEATFDAELLEVQQKELKDIIEKNRDLAVEVENYGKTEYEVIQNNLKAELALIDAKKLELEQQGIMNTALDEALKKQKELVKQVAENRGENFKPITLRFLMEDASSLWKKLSDDAQKSFSKSVEFFKESIQGAFSSFGGGGSGGGIQLSKILSLDGLKKIGSDLTDSLKEGGSKLWESIKDIDLGKVASNFGLALAESMNWIAALMNPDNINRAVSFVGEMGRLPEMLLNAFAKLDTMLQRFIDRFPAAFTKLMEGLPAIIRSITEKIPAIIDIIFDAIGQLLDRLPAILSSTIEKLPAIIEQVLNRLPEIIEKLFQAIPQIIAQIIQVLPDVITKILDKVPEIIETAITGILGAIGEIIASLIDTLLVKGGLERIVKAILQAIPRIIAAILKGIFNGLKRGLGAIFGGMKIETPKMDTAKVEKDLKKISRSVQNAADDVFAVIDIDKAKKFGEEAPTLEEVGLFFEGKIEEIRGLWQQFLDLLKKAWMWVWENILMPIFEVVRKAWQWVWDRIILPIVNAIKTAWLWVYDNIVTPLINGITAVWTWLRDSIVTPLLNGLSEAFMWVYNNIVTPILTGMQAAWQWVYDKIAFPLINGMQAAWQWVYDKIASPLNTGMQAAWQWVYDRIAYPLINGIQKAWQYVEDKIVKPIREAGTAIWDGLKAKFEGATEFLKGIGKKIWDGLKSGLDTLGSFFTKLFNELNPGALLEKVFKIDYKGKGTVEKTLNIDVPYANFATGGIVPGTAKYPGDHLKNDTKLYALSPGEGVIPRSKMRNPAVANLVDAILNDQLGFAFNGKIGGTLGQLGEGAKGFVGNVGEGIKDVARSAEAMGKFVVSTLGLDKPWEVVFQEVASGVMKMMQANALPTYHTGGMVGDRAINAQDGEFIFSRSSTRSIGANVLSEMNATGRLPQNGGNTIHNVLDIKPGAIVVQGGKDSGEQIADKVLQRIKRMSLDGKFILADGGIRST